jgi:hypothetical protein
MNVTQENKDKVVVLPKWMTQGMMLLAIVLVIAVIYLQLVRYKLVGQSITAHDTSSTAMLLSPELSFGLTNIIAALAI